MITKPSSQLHTSRGAAMIIFLMLMVMASTSLTFLLARSIYSDLSVLNSIGSSKQSYLAAESLAEEIATRLIFGTYSTVDPVETITMGGATAQATTTEDVVSDELTIESAGNLNSSVRKSQIILSLGAGSSFNYGLQAGNGGISLANSSGIVGNVYSNGTVEGTGSAIIRGDVISAGPTGYIFDIHATGSAWANTVEDSLIEGDLYVEQASKNITNSYSSVSYYGVGNDQPTTTFPIQEDLIDEWKQSILDYGTTIASTDPECSSGTYTIDDPATIGYLKVECNLDIVDTGSPATVLTLTGPVWVEGDLSFTSGPDIEVDSSVGRRSVQLIADNESNRLTSSRIEVRNSTNFSGSGDPRSYIMLLSMNESAEQGGSEVAIDVSQSANGSVLVYAGSGLIDIGNGIELKEVTGYQINVAQNTDVIYESGLQSLLFTSGPGGSYQLVDWQEVY